MLEKISCIVIEDEARSLNLMINLLKKIPRITLQAAFQDPEEALQFVQRNTPDLILLDIRMPKMDGLQFIERLEQENLLSPFIFVSAYEEYLIDALRKSAVDYLLKPVSLAHLEEAIDRYEVRKFKSSNSQLKQQVYSLNRELLRFNFKTGFEIVNRSNIVYLSADGNYTSIIMTNNRKLTISQNIGKFDFLIQQNEFIKIHRSTIINPRYFRKLVRYNRTCILGYDHQEYKLSISLQGLKVLDEFFASN
jgi:two-component system LytT family response regulator